MIFKDILLDLMQERGINQRQLSTAAGIPATTISGWIKANRLPDYYALIKLGRFFDVSADYLLGLCDDTDTALELPAPTTLPLDETKLLNDFRALSRSEKAQAAEYVHYLAHRNDISKQKA